MAKVSVFQCPGVSEVWNRLTAEYSCISFRVGTCPGGIAAAEPRTTWDEPRVVTLDNGADQEFEKCLRDDASLSDVLTKSGLAAWLAFVLLHEIGHHERGHRDPGFKIGDDEHVEMLQAEADEWASLDYDRLVKSKVLDEVPSEKMRAFQAFARRDA